MLLAFGPHGHLAGATCDDHPDVTCMFVHAHERLGHTVERLSAEFALARTVHALEASRSPPDEMPEPARQAAPGPPLPWEDDPGAPDLPTLEAVLPEMLQRARDGGQPQRQEVAGHLTVLVHHDARGPYVGLRRKDAPATTEDAQRAERALGWEDATREVRAGGRIRWLTVRPKVLTARERQEVEEARQAYLDAARRDAKRQRILAARPNSLLTPFMHQAREAHVRGMNEADLDAEIAHLERHPWLERPPQRPTSTVTQYTNP